ncbi:MAG: carboxypeptidase-like regulatory domain-containing protein [Terracidiphilus sp.]|jgi:hypothetical protein
MAGARIVALFLAAATPLASAQQFSDTIVTVQVTDRSGAPVPGAQVDIGPACADPSGGETDKQGRVAFNLKPGSWDTRLTVASPGFCPETKTVTILNQPSQTFPIELVVGGCPSNCTPICVTVESTEAAQPAQGRIAVRVAGVTGAVVPGARIEVDPSLTMPGPILKTDSRGYASFDLPEGIHTFTITEPGFYPWTHQINVPNKAGRTIEAVLQVAPICDGVTVTIQPPDIPFGVPPPILLPLQPLLNFDPLPPQRVKTRW